MVCTTRSASKLPTRVRGTCQIDSVCLGSTCVKTSRSAFAFAAGKSDEVGYVLDHGTHFPYLILQWFDTTGCKSSEVGSNFEMSLNPLSDVRRIASL